MKDKLFCGAEALFAGDRKTFDGNSAQGYWLTNVTFYSTQMLGDLRGRACHPWDAGRNRRG